MDPRTGLGRFREFRISNYQLMMQLIDVVHDDDRSRRSSQTPDVAERVELYLEHAEQAERADPAAARPCTATSSCSTSATRRSSTPRTASCSTRCSPSATSRSTCCGACASRTRCSRPASRSSTARSKTNVGELMLAYGGGGHEAAGTCQVENDDAAARARRADRAHQRRRLDALGSRRPCTAPDAHLHRADPVMARLIDDFGGPLPLEPDSRGRPARRLRRARCARSPASSCRSRPPRAIYGRAASSASAASTPTPEEILADDPDELRTAAGFSHAKVAYLRSLAEHVLAGELELDRLRELPDERGHARARPPSRGSASGRRTCS